MEAPENLFLFFTFNLIQYGGIKMKKVICVLGTLAICGLGFSQIPITEWTAQQEIIPSNPTQMAGAVVVSDKLYILGGNDYLDGDTNRVYRFAVDQTTGGLSIPDEMTSMPVAPPSNYAYINAQSVATSNRIYIAGGGYNATAPNRNNVTHIGVDASGNFTDAAWLESDAFSGGYDPELGAAAIPANGYLYAWGGDGNTVAVFDMCVYAKVNADGSLGAWQSGTTLPTTSWFPAACSIGNNIIMSIGIINDTSNANASDKVYVCQVNTDGTMGAWVEQTGAALPQPLYGTQLVAVNNTVFALGGRTTGGVTQNCVYRAVFNPATGTLGAWDTVTDVQLPDGVRYHCAVYHAKSARIIIVSIRRASDALISNEAYISSPLFASNVQDWTIY